MHPGQRTAQTHRPTQQTRHTGAGRHTGAVSTESAQLPIPDRSSGADPARFAAGQHEIFAGKHLTVGASSVVHAVEWAAWLGTLTLPVPLCRQAYGGPGTRGELRPTRWRVTCLRCRRAAGEPIVFLHESPDQLALFTPPQQRTTQDEQDHQ